jgi:hypothetical protein
MEAAGNALQFVEAHQYDEVIPLPDLMPSADGDEAAEIETEVVATDDDSIEPAAVVA